MNEFAITRGKGTTALVPLIHVAQLHQQNRGLQGVQPAVPANLFVVVADLHAMGAETATRRAMAALAVVTMPASPAALRFLVG